MGKRITTQVRGKGTPTHRAPSHRFKANLRHLGFGPKVVSAKIIDIEHDTARNTPIAKVEFNGTKSYIIATEGMGVGDIVSSGDGVDIVSGNTTFVSNIPEGTPVCNIESQPGDGGKFVRSSGTFALVISHEEKRSLIQMPSGQLKWFNPRSRATIGVVAGGGRTDKPFVTAGKKFYKMKSKASKYPKVRGVAMCAVYHPFGGGKHQHPGKPKTVSRNTPPGRKVGSIAARRTGGR